MAPRDSSLVTTTVKNKVDRTISLIFQAEISGPLLRIIRTRPSIEPGKTQQIKWAISTEDVDYGHLIIAQVYQFAFYKTPTAVQPVACSS